MDGFALNSGLSASIFARQPCNGQHRPGDWNCASCGFLNWQRRSACLRCSSPCSSSTKTKNQPRGINDTTNYTHVHAQSFRNNGTWKEAPTEIRQNLGQVSLSNAENTRPISSNIREPETHIRADAVLQDISGDRHARKLQRREPGLSTSHWAPRSSSAGQISSNLNQVWTRVGIQCFKGEYTDKSTRLRTSNHARSNQTRLPQVYQILVFPMKFSTSFLLQCNEYLKKPLTPSAAPFSNCAREKNQRTPVMQHSSTKDEGSKRPHH